MIYLINGSDKNKALEKFNSLVKSLSQKKLDSVTYRINHDNWDSDSFDEYIGGQGLFVKKYIVACNKLNQHDEAKDYISKNITHIADSPNIFIFLEELLGKKELRLFEKNAEKIQEFNKEENKVEEFNFYRLADAIGQRDRKSAWMLYQQALLENINAEEIFNRSIIWIVGTMFIVSRTTTVKDTQLKEFVYNKSKRYLKNFTKQEIDSIYENLIVLYQESRRGKKDIEIGLEKIILSI